MGAHRRTAGQPPTSPRSPTMTSAFQRPPTTGACGSKDVARWSGGWRNDKYASYLPIERLTFTPICEKESIWCWCTSTLEEVRLPPWRRRCGGLASEHLPHTRTHPVVLDCEPKEDQRKHINCDEVARKGKKHPVICKTAVALSLS